MMLEILGMDVYLRKIAKSFRNIKNDMHAVFEWVHYLNLSNQQVKTKLQQLEKRVYELEKRRF